MISELIQLQARAKALDNRLKELDALYQAGQEDIGRITRLKSTLESERTQILLELQETWEGDMPAPLADAVQKAQTPGGEEQAKESLEHLARERGWGEKVVEQIKQHKGDIVDLVVSVAVKAAKEMTQLP